MVDSLPSQSLEGRVGGSSQWNCLIKAVILPECKTEGPWEETELEKQNLAVFLQHRQVGKELNSGAM